MGSVLIRRSVVNEGTMCSLGKDLIFVDPRPQVEVK